jgi:predicted RNA-binding protein with PUA-like domain
MTTWLMKSEPSEYSIDDLARDGQSSWFGVRNYLARNYMRDMMRLGDRVLFYHSSCPVPGIYGLAEVVSLPHPDETQFEVGGDYYDAKSTREKPIWYCVDVGYIATFTSPITLTRIREMP